MFEAKIVDILKKNSKQLIISFILIFWGFICHGYMFFSKLPNFDDSVSLYNKGLTLEVGRWFIPFTRFLSKGMSIPIVIGLFSLICIVLSVWLVCDLLDIRSKIYVLVLGMLMISFPVVTGTFTFMFTADAYFLSLFFSCLSIWLVSKKSNAIRLVLSIILLAFSIGIYQAYYDVACALVCIYILLQLTKNKGEIFSKSGSCKNIVAMLCTLAGGMILYLLINKIVFYISGVEYETATLMELFQNIPKAIYDSYVNFISIFIKDFAGISYCRAVKVCLFGLWLLFVIIYEVLIIKKGLWNIILGNVVLLILPIALNFINFAMINREMDTLMIYSYIFIPILPFTLVYNKFTEVKLEYIYKVLISFLIMILSWQYMLQSNRIYVGMDLAKSAAISYYTSIITEIKMTEGYRDDMPVVFLGENTEDETVFNNGEVYRGDVRGVMHLKRYINMYSRDSFMAYYCGFSPVKYSGSLEELEKQKEIKNMPYYPDDGAIAIVNDVLIVKIGN